VNAVAPVAPGFVCSAFAKSTRRASNAAPASSSARCEARAQATLVTERGILTETPAILVYIAQTHPTARLAPFDDPFAFAELQAFNAYLCATVHVAHAHRMRGYRWADEPEALEAMKKKVPQSVGACFALIEREFFRGPWVMGEAYTIADPYLFALASWMEADGVDPHAIPKVHDHRRRVAERPAVRRALAAESAP
jgi:glutathione S-transferase